MDERTLEALPQHDIATSVRRLMAILEPGGVLYLSWRVTKGSAQRDRYGRLYGAFDADLVRRPLAGNAVLLDEEVVSASSGKPIHRLVVRKPPRPAPE
jgi:hypothetical protein